MQELARLLAELAADDPMDGWDISVSPVNIAVTAATRERYEDGEAAWDGGRDLWSRILDLGHELTGEGADQIGVFRSPGQDKAWRGKVFMVLEPPS